MKRIEFICSHATQISLLLAAAFMATVSLGGGQDRLVCSSDARLGSSHLILESTILEGKYRRIEITERDGERVYNEVFDWSDLESKGVALDLQLASEETYVLKRDEKGFYVVKTYPLPFNGSAKTRVPLQCKA
jgi:hypothetical protein